MSVIMNFSLLNESKKKYTYAEVLKPLIETFSEVLGRKDITASTKLATLNLDSLDKTELIINFEEKIGVNKTVPDDVWTKIPDTATVGELAKFIVNLLNK